MGADCKVKVRKLSKSFAEKQVLKDIDFEVSVGESFVIMGGSGSGKSVLIKSIIGLHIPNEGAQVLLDGQDITYTPLSKRASLLDQSGVLFQGGALFDSLAVWENICFTQLERGTITRRRAQELALEKLKSVGLDERVLRLSPAELSGGMIKRVAFARAIANNPKLIFLDEPTAGLDPIMSGVISELIKKCSKQLGATTITITHDMNCASRIADKAALIYQGKFIWSGMGSEILTSKNEFIDQFVHGKPTGPMV